MANAKKIIYERKKELQQFEELVAGLPGLERKGASVPYTSLNGHMFANLTKEGILQLRLPDGEREKFIRKYKTGLSEAYGIIRKEYVDVPEKLLANTRELKPYFLISFNYIRTLKLKATTRKAKR
jgi:hypothetical protein